ncbi:hypothetical protein DTO021D3_22 [Paecilomyces variotii]|nr:hypothetical protein DTO032I3_22 [Paecilomyces variotii]KAJ9282685.1 hypothetical protein DTO021D3_22 [Paecilomyces variotii]KAJ9343933.1 hypothetical protein DTO027B6_3369 [Paecilomyces variotii]KAJ9393721.1 hypothetical protein DTO032I4_492 [Paecilomyces variotii]
MNPRGSVCGRTKSLTNDPNDPKIVVWTKLQVPPGEELDSYCQPLLHAVGHESTVWAREQGNPDIVMLATLWYTTSELRDFMASPSAQLYRESLANASIVPLISWETIHGYGSWFGPLSRSFTQLFWVYFPAPMTQAQQAEISSLRGIRPPVMGFSIPQSQLRQRHLPVQLWATQTEYLHGQEAQLMLWPHFWRDAEKAEWRFSGTGTYWGSPTERFIENLENVAILHGTGGMGKTQLAIQFARVFKDAFTAIFWINGQDEYTLTQCLASITSRLQEGPADLDPIDGTKNEKELKKDAQKALRWLLQDNNTDWLLIHDNIDQNSPYESAHGNDIEQETYDIHKYLPSVDHGSIIITTRLQQLAELGTISYQVNKIAF